MNNSYPPSLKKLFFTFLKLGATAFGGPAMVTYIRRRIVEKNNWIDPAIFDNGLALCQAIPGAIVMQVVAYTGLKIRGIKGAVVSFIGFGIPAFALMLILSVLYMQFKEMAVVESIMSGLRVIIAAIVAHAAFTFGKRTLKYKGDFIIVAIAAALFLTKLHPALIVVIASFLGILLTKPAKISPSAGTKANTFRFFLFLLGIVLLSLLLLFFLNRKYFILSTVMLRIDLFAFGGGFAAVPVMFHEIVGIFNWMDKKTFLDGIILGQITPGSIIIAATFVGYLKYGTIGSLVATISVFTPSFLILMGMVPFLDRLKAYPQFDKAVNGILCSFVGLLIVVVWHFGVDISWSFPNIALAVVAFGVLLLNIEVAWVILGGILCSYLINSLLS
jgi:chromate transporter